jgi:glycosyltransferase involved in cell wall biosynthesis
VEAEAGGVPIHLLCVTRLDQETKNVGPLLRGIAEARKNTDHNFRLIVAGDGFQRGALRREAERLGLGDVVEWPGWVSPAALARLRGRADAAVQPSEHESFGLAALEATGAGLPLVACGEAGVVPDLAALGAAVVPFRVASPAAIATALNELAGRFPDLRRQAIEARGRILSRYSWEAHASRYARVLRESMEKENGHHR